MKQMFRTILAIIFSAAIIYVGVVLLLLNSSVTLPPPTNPPAFSVSYPYNFYSFNPMEMASINKEIANDMENIKNAGFGGIKIGYHFRGDNSTSNKIVVAAAKNGLYPIGQFSGDDIKPKDRAFTDAELAEWENFVRTEVGTNKDLVYYWEVWNEPCMTELRFRYGTPAEYLELLKRTYEIIKEANPSAQVIVTADYTDTEAETFTNEFLALGGADYLDYLSFHPYNALDANGRYDLAETIAQEKALATKYNKPLWITEIGLPDSDSSEAHQADVALTVFQAAYEHNIPIVWFYWSDRRLASVDGKSGWGLIRSDNGVKPAYEIIRSFIKNIKNISD